MVEKLEGFGLPFRITYLATHPPTHFSQFHVPGLAFGGTFHSKSQNTGFRKNIMEKWREWRFTFDVRTPEIWTFTSGSDGLLPSTCAGENKVFVKEELEYKCHLR